MTAASGIGHGSADTSAKPFPEAEGEAAYATALDGSPVDAFALLPPGPGPHLIAQRLQPGSTILELGCGAGRLLRPLHEQGHKCTGVDESPEMLAKVPPGIETIEGAIETIDLEWTYDAVILASFLVNTPDVQRRRAFLDCAKAHAHGEIFVQRLDPELVPEAVDAESEEDGVVYAMRDVQHIGTLFQATMQFTFAETGTTYEHPYRGEVLDDTAFETTVRSVGLKVKDYLDGQRTWAVLEG
ncbi:MAG TPA: methyltransferase domain-containing protein [Acidimicrobiales bacterium]|nr:methyltransferase domain-containing protein [Acidimicrobiales bacterium]